MPMRPALALPLASSPPTASGRCEVGEELHFLFPEAALAGEGVILGWHHMVAGYLASGRLVLAHPGCVAAGRGNLLRCQAAALQRPAVARFVEHLLQSVAR